MKKTREYITQKSFFLCPDPSRILFKPFIPPNEGRITRIAARILTLSEKTVQTELNSIGKEFLDSKLNVEKIFLDNFKKVKPYLPTDASLSIRKKTLIGAYFTHEYSFESTAVFNPSIVPHLDQTNLQNGQLRFIMSLRSVGEGHISTISFRTGILDEENTITIDPPKKFAYLAEQIPNATYDKLLFSHKLYDLGLDNKFATSCLNKLPDSFTFNNLIRVLKDILYATARITHTDRLTYDKMIWLAKSNYETRFSPDVSLSERVIFPVSPTEINGIEDARFVLFTEDDGTKIYYATYTAYDGRAIMPEILETRDFLCFKMITLNGQAAVNKGMALFPRKIQGQYVMLSRQDNENISLMYSNNIHFWDEASTIIKPAYPWEFVQLGNCGAPIETDAGWLVLTHGVGSVRKYSIGAVLLDKEDPSTIIGRLADPLFMPDESERSGYVPNVFYTCGSIINNGHLIIPYGITDSKIGFATLPLHKLLDDLQNN